MPVSPGLLLQALLRQEDTCVDRCLSNWKIGFAALLFLEGLVFAHIVYLIKRSSASYSQTYSYIFHLGNSLSGGVFFATGVLHILPEALELIAGEHEEELEEGEQENEQEGEESEEGHEEESFPWAFLIVMLSFYLFLFIESVLIPKLLRTKPAVKASESDEESGHLKTDDVRTDDSDTVVEYKGFKSKEFVTGAVEILGVSAHSMFESIALGLSGSFTTSLNIFIATAAHRWATASAISFKLLRSLGYLPFLVLLFSFSSIVPIGIGIGAALGGLSQTSQGILFSISAGTFVYIGVYEVMADEFVEHRKWPLAKFMMTIFGASIITIITVILHVLDIHG